MRDEIRSLSDSEIDLVAGGPGCKDGTSNTVALILPHIEQDNAVANVQASAAGQTKQSQD